MTKHSRFDITSKLLLLLLFVATVFVFIKLGQHPIEEWDEARTGINAIEMLQNGDYFNVYYARQLDDWINKPPLVYWMMIASFDAFGYNEFALRLPSALSVLLSLSLLFQIIKLYKNPRFAFGTCFLLLTVNGLLGFHVGRTGDFDGVLVSCLLGSIFFFLKYVDFKSQKAIYGTAICLGLAFWTKGPAAFILLPAWFLYLVFYKKIEYVLKNKHTWFALFLGTSIIVAWVVAMAIFGIEKESVFGNSSTLGRLFWYDVVARFSQSDFTIPEGEQTWDFFFVYMDYSFNLWNYVFYISLLCKLYLVFKSKQSLRSTLHAQPLLIFSICIWATLGLVFSLVATNHRWYMAPALPFIAITTTYGILFLIKKWRPMMYILGGLLLFTFVRHFHQLWTPEAKNSFVEQHCEQMATASQFIVADYLPAQNILLLLYFCQPNVQFVEQTSALPSTSSLVFMHQDIYIKEKKILENYEIIGTDGIYVLLSNEKK